MEFNSQTTHILKIIANSNYEPNDSPICIDCLIVKCKGSNPAIPTLFVEIDYMYDGSTSFKPTTDMNLNGAPYTFDPENDVIDYFIYYYQTLGVEVKPIIDERIRADDVDLDGDGDTIDTVPSYYQNYIDPNNPRELHKNEQKHHRFCNTHIYILYSSIPVGIRWINKDRNLIKMSSFVGASDPEHGVVIQSKTYCEEVLNIVFDIKMEKKVLLHEIGHCIYIGIADDYDVDGDGYIDEVYSGSSEDLTDGDSTSIMGLGDPVTEYPEYHWEDLTTMNINVDWIWSVGENAFWGESK